MSVSTSIRFAREPTLPVEEFIEVLARSTLGERRPLHDRATMQGMIDHADLIFTARVESRLVGVARAITDFHYCTYLADLAVDCDFQRQGIGTELLHLIHEAAGQKTMLILLAAPTAETYYPHIGLQPHHSCWTIPRPPS